MFGESLPGPPRRPADLRSDACCGVALVWDIACALFGFVFFSSTCVSRGKGSLFLCACVLFSCFFDAWTGGRLGGSCAFAGGYGDSKGRFNEVYEFNTHARSWRLVAASGDVPRPVYLHSATQHGSSMIVFGGNSGKESNELHSYDLTKHSWQKWPGAGPLSIYPAARYGHASCVYGGSQLLIVGGCRSNNTYFRDSYSMDLATRRWRRLDDLPLDLAYHSLFTWQDRAYLFGGFNGKTYVQFMYELNTQTGKWNVVPASGQAPPPMCGAATVIKGHEFFVFGQFHPFPLLCRLAQGATFVSPWEGVKVFFFCVAFLISGGC